MSIPGTVRSQIRGCKPALKDVRDIYIIFLIHSSTGFLACSAVTGFFISVVIKNLSATFPPFASTRAAMESNTKLGVLSSAWVMKIYS